MEEIITYLGDAMRTLSSSIQNQGLGLGNAVSFIKPFSGDVTQFKNWIKNIEKYSRLNGFDDDKKVKVAFMTTDGTASDFIVRWQDSTVLADQTWTDLKTKLNRHFSDCADSDHARSLLRTIKQGPFESVSGFSERLYNIAKDAFVGVDTDNREANNLIQKELINHFIDGLKHDAVKYRIMRNAPTTFQEALDMALTEQNLRRRFEVRNNREIGEIVNRSYEIKRNQPLSARNFTNENNFPPPTRHFPNERNFPPPQNQFSAQSNRFEIPMDISSLRKRICQLCNRAHGGPCRRNFRVSNYSQNGSTSQRSNQVRFNESNNRYDARRFNNTNNNNRNNNRTLNY